MDKMVEEIGNTFKKSALKCGMAKEVVINKPSSKKKRQMPNKPWYNNECEIKRNFYFSARNDFAINKTK